jgi:hypothetical protein
MSALALHPATTIQLGAEIPPADKSLQTTPFEQLSLFSAVTSMKAQAGHKLLKLGIRPQGRSRAQGYLRQKKKGA